jgi:transposase
MYRVTLTEEQRQELNRRAHQAGVAPSTRDRLEMVRLADAGWSIPEIALHLGLHEQTVRRWIKAYLAGGFDRLINKPRGGSCSALTPLLLEAVRQEVAKGERSWNAKQLADWIAEAFGVRRSSAQLRGKLRAVRLSYKRTGGSLRHKQKPQEVAEKKAALSELEKRGRSAS